MSDEQLRRLYPQRQLKSYSSQTPTSLEQLKKVLSEDRARGFAISENFFELGISAIAAPVFDADGDVVAAVHVTVPEGSATSAELHGPVAKKVVTAANKLSDQLDYQPSRGARKYVLARSKR
jgi:DNA-binding IclR family transcriptional regulator